MKSNLMLRKFSRTAVPGTMNQEELRTFFGGKIIYSENIINVNDDTINFSQVINNLNFGYQYFEQNLEFEFEFFENLTDLKLNNQKIALFNQTSTNYDNNTRWQINVNGSTILKDYLFFKLKQERVFKIIKPDELYANHINNAIYEYITYNIFSRYRLDRIDFYVEYYDINKQTVYDNILLQYNPMFDVNVYKKENLSNMTVSNYDPYKFDSINILYNQSKPSTKYSFNYYFDLIFTKI